MNQILSVQALRGLAALSVAYGHAAYDALQIAAREGRALDPAFRELSAAGVDLFFVISGFVMVWSSRALFGQPGAAQLFVRRRLARIVPLYWATTTVFLLALLILPQAINTPAPSLVEIAKSYAFVPFQRADDGSLQPIYRLGWTLNYEMVFYLSFAALLWMPARALVAALATIFCALVVAGAVFAPQSAPLQFWTQPIILEFVFGAGIGLAYLSGLRLPPLVGHAAALAALVWFAVATGGVFPQGAFERVWALGGPAALLLAGLVLSSAGRIEGPFARGFALLGDASYALYLIHPLAIRGLNVVWVRSGLGDVGSGWLFIGSALALSIAASLVVYRLFERPLTRWLQGSIRT